MVKTFVRLHMLSTKMCRNYHKQDTEIVKLHLVFISIPEVSHGNFTLKYSKQRKLARNAGM